MFYLIPTLFDYVLYGIFFITGYRLAELGASAVTASAPMAVWGIVYALSASFAGRVTNSENALKLLRVSGAGTAVCAVLFMFFQSICGMLVLVGVMGIISAFYSIPFQMCANEGSNGKSPERAAGFYTFSWSIGTAAGTFGFGCLPGSAGFAVNAVIGILMMLLARQNRTPQIFPEDKTGTPQTMAAVWIFAAAAAFCMAVAGAVLPLRSVELKTGVFAAGAVLGVLRLVQGVVALLLIPSIKKLTGTQLLCCGVFSGAGGMACLGVGSGIGWLFAGSFLFGVCGGIFYFSLVYYALSAEVECARYLGVNEMILGITGIAGSAVGGAAVQFFGTRVVFSSCAVLLLMGGAAAGGTRLIQNKKRIQGSSEENKTFYLQERN